MGKFEIMVGIGFAAIFAFLWHISEQLKEINGTLEGIYNLMWERWGKGVS